MSISYQIDDGYGSWCIAIRAWREIRVRSREYWPANEREWKWREQGPVPPSQLDTAQSEENPII